MKTQISLADILRSPTKQYALKATDEALKYLNTWADVTDYLDWNVVNELQTTENVADNIPDEIIAYIRNKVRDLILQKWETKRRYDICRKAAQQAIDAVLKNIDGIEFSDNQAKHGLSQFIRSI